LDYRKIADLPVHVADYPMNWASNEDGKVICYNSLLNVEKAALEHDEIRERLTLDREPLCEMIKTSRDRVYVFSEESAADGEGEGDKERDKQADDPPAVQVHPIERQQDYHLLLVYREPGESHSSAQRWRLRLSSNGIVQCKVRDAHWPSPEEQKRRAWRDRMAGWKWRK